MAPMGLLENITAYLFIAVGDLGIWPFALSSMRSSTLAMSLILCLLIPLARRPFV